MLLLLCAATKVEANICRQALAQLPPLPDLTIEVLKTGIGYDCAIKSLQNRLQRTDLAQPNFIWSVGFAGSVSADLKVYTTITAHQILDEQNHPHALRPIAKVHSVALKSVTAVLKSDQFLAQTQLPFQAIDMESLALWRLLQQHNSAMVFQVLRMISDSPTDPLPDAINSWVTWIHSKKSWQLFLRALKQTARDFGALIKLGQKGMKLKKYYTQSLQLQLQHVKTPALVQQ